MKISRHRSLRIVGWVAAYVVALHAMLASFVAPPSIAAAAAGNHLPVLCLTSDSGAPDTGTTTPAHGGSQHCAICALGAGAMPPPSIEPTYVAFAIDATLDAGAESAPPRPAPAAHPGNPRAPPSLA